MWPSITADTDNRIHVVWLDLSQGNGRKLFYKHTIDSGGSWSPIKILTGGWGWPEQPSIRADSGNNIHIVWQNYTPLFHQRIYYKRSTDCGKTWFQTYQLTWTTGESWSPSIAVDTKNGIYVVWKEKTPENHEIFYIHSTDSGATWVGTTRLTWNAGKSCLPSIAVDLEGGVHVVWQDDFPGNEEIFYKHSTDSGLTWSGITRLSWNSRESRNPQVVSDSGNNIHVVWDNLLLPKCAILYKSSTDGGTTWSRVTRLTWNGGSFPSITADAGKGIHVVWINLFYNNWEIFYKNSTNSGATWSGTTRLTWNEGGSFYPSIAADSDSRIHVVWHDDTQGNGEIYYKSRK
jgi:hypothetical protein